MQSDYNNRGVMKKEFLYSDDGDGFSSDSSIDPNFANEMTLQTDQSLLYNQTPADKLRLAASQGQLSTVKRLLLSGATFEPDQGGRTALHYAAVSGSAAIVGLLAAEGCVVNTQDNFGYTALHRAAAQGHVDAIRALLAEGCSIDIQDVVHGNGALHEAAWNGFSETLDLMVKHRANVQLCNKAGFSALHLAAQNGHNQSARALLYGNCNPNIKNNYGDTCLHTAARYGHAGVTRILLSAQCNVDIQNKNGDTCMHICSALKRRKIAKLICNCGSNPTLKNKQNETAMDVAKRKKYDEIMQTILSQPKLSKKHRATLRKVKSKNEDQPKKEKRAFFFFRKSKTIKEKEVKAQTVALSDTASSHHTDNSDLCLKQVYKDPGIAPSTSHWAREVYQRPSQLAPAASTTSQLGVKGLLSDYVDNSGTQYYRDLAGNIKQGPIGYQAVACNCAPSTNRVDQRLNGDPDTHIRENPRIPSHRIDTLTRQRRVPTDHRNQFIAQSAAFDHRMAMDRARVVRLNPDMDISSVKSDLQCWMDGQLMGNGKNAVRDTRMTAYNQPLTSNFNKHSEKISHQLTKETKQARYGISYEREDITMAVPKPSFVAHGGVYGIKGQGRIYRSKSDDTLSMSSVGGAGNRMSRRLQLRCNEELMQQHIQNIATGNTKPLEQLPRNVGLRRRDTVSISQQYQSQQHFQYQQRPQQHFQAHQPQQDVQSGFSTSYQTKPSALHHQSSMRRHEYQSQQSQQWPNFQQSERLFNSQRHLNPRRDPQQASFRVRVRPRSIADMLDDSPQVQRAVNTKQRQSLICQQPPPSTSPLVHQVKVNSNTLPRAPISTNPALRSPSGHNCSNEDNFTASDSEICVDHNQDWFKERRRDEIMVDRALPELPGKVHNESGSLPDSGYGVSSSALPTSNLTKSASMRKKDVSLPISKSSLGVDIGRATQV